MLSLALICSVLASEVPVTGKTVPELAGFDEEMLAHMESHHIPGGSLAVLRDGKLIFARGYGFADKDKTKPVQPDTLFRLASVSKPITGLVAMRLKAEGKLRYEDRAFELLGFSEKDVADKRLLRVTVLQLLQHTGGWNRDKSGDPMFQAARIVKDLGIKGPPTSNDVIRWMLGRPLDSDPGAEYHYSNFGYCVLGRIIEKVTGKSYEDAVKSLLLTPAGIKGMAIGKSALSEMTPQETYYFSDGNVRSIFDPSGPRVPAAYNLDPLTMDAHGGWIASAVDLMKLSRLLQTPFVTPGMAADVLAPPHEPVSRGADGKLADAFYTMGSMVRPQGRSGKANFWHAGAMPGTYTLWVRLSNGMSWAALFNRRPGSGDPPEGEIDHALHRAASRVKRWPTHDLFRAFR
ncbi:MAG: beta-lactamase family protein [Armatimonadetes bacterium]|nr:beta-lactamase family protein [Armatimonadota bacterium]